MMLSPYVDVLRTNSAWKFSLAGLILRLPMSMIGISIILLIKATYGNYSFAGLTSAVNIIATAVASPQLARLVDRHGQLKIMAPAHAICALSTLGLLGAAVAHAPHAVVLVFAALSGASWGTPGALVRSRWVNTLTRPDRLTTAFAFESAMDEVVYILGPVLATVLGTAFHPGIGMILIVAFLLLGGVGFYSQRSTQPTPTPRPPGTSGASVLRIPAMVVMVLSFIGMGAMFGANDVAIVEFAAECGAPAMSGVLLAVSSFASLVAGLAYGAKTWRRPLWQLYAVGVLTMALTTSLYLTAHSLWTMALVMAVSGLTFAPTMTNVNTIITKVVDPHKLTEGLAWVSTSLNLGLSLGSALAGPAIDTHGSYGGYAIMVAAAWAMVVLMLVGLPVLRRATTSKRDLPLS